MVDVVQKPDGNAAGGGLLERADDGRSRSVGEVEVVQRDVEGLRCGAEETGDDGRDVRCGLASVGERMKFDHCASALCGCTTGSDLGSVGFFRDKTDMTCSTTSSGVSHTRKSSRSSGETFPS